MKTRTKMTVLGAIVVANLGVGTVEAFACTPNWDAGPTVIAEVLSGSLSVYVHGGLTLRAPEVQLVFWSSAAAEWGTGHETPTDGQVLGAMIDMINSPYLSKLSQYVESSGRRPGAARLLPKVHYVNSSGGCDVDAMLQAEFDAGRLPAPSAGNNVFYLVPIATEKGCSQGAHHMGTYRGNGNPFYYGFSGNPGGTLPGLMAYLTHELVEGITDPVQDASGAVGKDTVTDPSGCLVIGTPEVGDIWVPSTFSGRAS